MHINCFSITFWFNIFKSHQEIIDKLQNFFQNEYDRYNFLNITDDFFAPVITAVNNSKRTNLTISQINLQYNMDKVEWQDFSKFKEKALRLFELLTDNGIELLHTAIFINGEFVSEDILKKISKNTLNKSLINKDLVDINLKLGKIHEDLFYKIIAILNKKQINIPEERDELGRLTPIPLISWYNAHIDTELGDISYEINDKYSFDNTKNYHTTEFYLNKMLYILENDFHNDIDNLLKKGVF